MTASASVGIDTEHFWSAHQPGFRFTAEKPGTPEFFAAVERHRYELEPHIPEIVKFDRWRGLDVLEVGCGIATDGANFARAGARYTGVDQSSVALDFARQRFGLQRLAGSFVQSKAGVLPFTDGSFDLVYSHGVIHHLDDAQGVAAEFRRILRPGGTIIVMVYHRNSFNYWVSIMGVRRILALSVLAPGAPRILAGLTGERTSVLEGHRKLLRKHGWRYLLDSQRFLSNNTDGPGNPLSEVYTRERLISLFPGFGDHRTTVRNLNLRLYPGLRRLAATTIARRLERRWGWHLYIEAHRSAEQS